MMSQERIASDSILDLCQNQQRRIVVEVLAEEQRSLTLDDLTEAIFKYSLQESPTETSENALSEIRLSLYHVDLPNLASEGFINYDREHELAKPTEQLDQVQQTLSTILDADPSPEAPIEL